MIRAVIISRDAGLRQRIQRPGVDWVGDPEQFEVAVKEGFSLALVDVCDCEGDIGSIVRDCRERGEARSVIAFLSECGGDAAIRAHLAGADRVIPVAQLEDELPGLLDA